MKIVKPQAATSAGGITKSNYAERACAFIRFKGGEGFVVRGIEGRKGSAMTKLPATDAQWLAWLGYLDGLMVSTKFMRFNGEATVPAEWPEEFDPACGTSDKSARLLRGWEQAPERNVSMRAKIVQLFKDLSKGFPETERRPDFDKRRLAPRSAPDAETLERWKSPVTLSPALRRLRKPEDEF